MIVLKSYRFSCMTNVYIAMHGAKVNKNIRTAKRNGKKIQKGYYFFWCF